MDKAEEHNEFIELHALVLINVTSREEIVDFLLTEWDFQFLKAALQLFVVYSTIWILIYSGQENIQQLVTKKFKPGTFQNKPFWAYIRQEE